MMADAGVDIENMSDEEIQQLVNLGILPGEQDILAKQMEQADLMRNAEGPEGRTFRNNIFQAANPLEHLGAGLKNFAGQRDAMRIQDEQRGLLGKQAEGRAKFFDLLRQKKAAPPIPPAPPGPYTPVDPMRR